jgi:bacillolysin
MKEDYGKNIDIKKMIFPCLLAGFGCERNTVLFYYAILLPLVFMAISCGDEDIDPQNKNGTVITKRPDGVITSVNFSAAENPPTSADDFFNVYLKIKPYDEFRKTRHNTTIKGFVHEHFDQYYYGIRVEDAGYNFHYEHGKMFLAHGHYVVIKNLDPNPFISPLDAKNSFSKYKVVPIASIIDFEWELLIKEIPPDKFGKTKLVYRIYLNTYHENNTEIGYVDAHTGKTLLAVPILIN